MANVYNCMVLASVRLSKYSYDVRILAPEIRSESKPGQFIRVLREDSLTWIPVSICNADGDVIRLIIDTRVPESAWIAESKMGDILNILGPYGPGFNIPKGKNLLVGSEHGIDPLIFAARRSENVHVLLSFPTSSEIILVTDFADYSETVQITTDDGSVGHPGGVITALEEKLKRTSPQFDNIFACGPANMLEEVSAISKKHGIPFTGCTFPEVI